ncbi:hypothetical protein E5288_WYG018073 [Bos mutus]|uniref:Uncharacterized protein n=1 Tax=Bos mutus TaxID=72004 RepID=A0A6B0RGI1_9CETA|nr:hypothetical protein [Bos mutus]
MSPVGSGQGADYSDTGPKHPTAVPASLRDAVALTSWFGEPESEHGHLILLQINQTSELNGKIAYRNQISEFNGKITYAWLMKSE